MWHWVTLKNQRQSQSDFVDISCKGTELGHIMHMLLLITNGKSDVGRPATSSDFYLSDLDRPSSRSLIYHVGTPHAPAATVNLHLYLPKSHFKLLMYLSHVSPSDKSVIVGPWHAVYGKWFVLQKPQDNFKYTNSIYGDHFGLTCMYMCSHG